MPDTAKPPDHNEEPGMFGKTQYQFVPAEMKAAEELRVREVLALERIAASVSSIAAYFQMIIERVVVQMRDVDRAKVYGEHLGKKLQRKKNNKKRS